MYAVFVSISQSLFVPPRFLFHSQWLAHFDLFSLASIEFISFTPLRIEFFLLLLSSSLLALLSSPFSLFFPHFISFLVLFSHFRYFSFFFALFHSLPLSSSLFRSLRLFSSLFFSFSHFTSLFVSFLSFSEFFPIFALYSFLTLSLPFPPPSLALPSPTTPKIIEALKLEMAT